MKWLRNPLRRAPRTGRPQPSGWCVDNGTCIDANWYPVPGGLVRQCDSCGTVSAVLTQTSPTWIAALQTTDGRPAEGWDGCLD